jgi:hypothetical protein
MALSCFGKMVFNPKSRVTRYTKLVPGFTKNVTVKIICECRQTLFAFRTKRTKFCETMKRQIHFAPESKQNGAIGLSEMPIRIIVKYDS